MDLEILEGLALAEDRTAALAQLLPGSAEHDYYRALVAQQRGAHAEADAILAAWPDRHGATADYQRLRLRQTLYRLGGTADELAVAADEMRDRLGVEHGHQAEVPETDPARPTRVPSAVFDGTRLLQQAAGMGTDLAQVTDEGCQELVGWQIDPQRRRVLLGRIGHTPHPALVALMAEELASRGSASFGSLAVHGQLTLAQLWELAEREPSVRTHAGWVSAVLQRMRPPATVDLELDRDERDGYLAALWGVLAELPPASNSLKAHVLWHLLDAGRRRGTVDRALLAAYLKLPRQSGGGPVVAAQAARGEYAQLGADFRGVTGLAATGDDEALLRDLVHLDPEGATALAPWLDAAWLARELATATLLAGGPGTEQATTVLGPARAAALHERVDLAWCGTNPPSFAPGAPVVLEAFVKNVPELVVKVFRVDPIAYFEHRRKEVDTDLDLDGLAASHEVVLRFAEPPVRRVRRRIELPMCARAGTYVIDLIGNGTSSRALLRIGRLRHALRLGAAGHVLTVLAEDGTPLPGARAWIGAREYTADERGELVVPFSTQASTTPVLLAHGDLATVQHLTLTQERYALELRLGLEREGLTEGRPARAIARLALTVAGAPAPLALLQRATWEITVTDRRGVAVTKAQPLAASEGDATVLEWPLGEDAASVALAVRGSVAVISTQREQELTARAAFSLAAMHGTQATEALYLARTAAGWVLSALGKTGEARARRPVRVGLRHLWSRLTLTLELATDDAGRIELGPLPGCELVTATLGTASQSWPLFDPAGPRAVVEVAGAPLALPVPTLRDPEACAARASLVELRAGAPLRHVPDAIAPLAGGLAIAALPPGEYQLRAPGLGAVALTLVAGVRVATTIVAADAVRERTRLAPVIAAVAVDAEALHVTLRGASRATRVHVLATRFAPDPAAATTLVPPVPGHRADRARAALYISGRELGDEYRYVLDRRTAPRHPGSLLARPGLLLHPWARRATTTGIQTARAGGHFASASAPAPAGAPMAGRARGEPQRDGAGYVTYDFLAAAPAVLANLAPDEAGALAIPRAALGDAQHVTLLVDDPAGWLAHGVPLPELPLAPRDRRLRVALAAERHAMQRKQIAPLRAGEQLAIADLATAQVHLLDSLARAHDYLLSLRDDAVLREFAFVTRWAALPDAERRELYDTYACHELHVFLYVKDRAFFDAVVRPALLCKRVKTFLDHWLLGEDLAAYVEPAALARLNAVERALLAHRLPADGPQLARLLADEVAAQPPDPGRDARLIDALLGAAALAGDSELQEAKADAFAAAETTGEYAQASFAAGPPAPRAPGSPPPPPSASLAAPKAKKVAASAGPQSFDDEAGGGGFDADLERRAVAPPLYRGADRTQELAETNWWRRTPGESDAAMIAPNRLWRDLAQHAGGVAGFLSPALGLAANSFAEAMCALAVIDLPFAAGTHAVIAEGPALAIAAASDALVGTSQLVDGELASGGAPLVVGQTFVRADDRYQFVDGQQVDRYVTGPLATGVVYTCLVVLANPTSTRQRISALVQIPRGSIAVGGARQTTTLDVVLGPYGTHGHEYAFYFPTAGTWSHFPVHVTRGGEIVAAAPPVALTVVAGGAAPDTSSWAYVSQHGTLAEVIALLAGENLAALDLSRIAWRMREPSAYAAVLAALEARRAFAPVLWGYALLHRDRPRIRTWLRAHAARLLDAGPVLDMPVVGLDAEALGAYEHLEYAPLVHARAHPLGGKLRILNDGLAQQYRRFLELVAHRPAPTAEDLLAAAAYYLLQDRATEAIAALARLGDAPVVDRMQRAYLEAYAACLVGDVGRARTWAEPWRAATVPRWTRRFAALLGLLDEVATGAAPPAPAPGPALDLRGREAQLGDLAARQPTFELHVDAAGVRVRQQHVPQLELRYFEMDVELLFSRQPFVASDVSRFSYIEPGHREVLAAPAAEQLVPWPAPLRGRNVVVEGVGAGIRAARVHYAHDLATTLAHQYGQVRVQRGSDGAPLPATYVKVYARNPGGDVAFYKDGYTDLRGWFDYATLSTDALDRVERFALLVCSDGSGATILETAPPQR